ELSPLEQHVAPAAMAAQPDVGPEPVDEPLARTAGMRSPKADDVAEVHVEDGPAGHPRERTSIDRADQTPPRPCPVRSAAVRRQRRGWPWAGTSERSVAGKVSSSAGVTVSCASGYVAPIWAMTPPVRVSVPVRICGLPMARISKVSPIASFSTDSAPGAP